MNLGKKATASGSNLNSKREEPLSKICIFELGKESHQGCKSSLSLDKEEIDNKEK